MQISEISYQSNDFPDRLHEIASPPKQLFCIGTLHNDSPHVAIVGSRKVTEYGRETTYQLSFELAKAGIVIVSGLAQGVDGIAHQAAIDAGGLTLAVQACGLDQIYPTKHRPLAKQILASGGAIITEYPFETIPFKSNFPARNRIIAGLSLAVIVTEADASSGSLITANFALEQNRLVLAVPGNITSPRSAGPNNLLRSGAIPVTNASDVLEALDLEAGQPMVKVRAESAEEALILKLLAEGHRTSQTLIEHSHLSAGRFATIISLMEITGKVRNLGAGHWAPR